LRLAIIEGVVTAHNALQVVELHDHFADQVRFAQFTRTPDPCRVGVEGRGQILGKGYYTGGLVVNRPQLLLEYDSAQLFAAFSLAMLVIGFIKESRIGQARTDDLFIAFDHTLRLATFDIGDRHEEGQQVAVGIHHVEILLVFLHRGDQRLGGNL